ncbi:ABC transporter substrate-binding protein [Actinomadura sp. LD22]|uniref:ABC transporter substrate-binding protein n=1 Tax=Actinomadura physcomitrii TaxID=2650748 RepID=A0A6I4MG19_9ACTN|nr:ABC transporter substrate-binding protein [Actinomadura physcomitrii]MWA03515.1 ABC transporter substrate-binding protein [Actinomadura physcomitrii]
MHMRHRFTAALAGVSLAAAGCGGSAAGVSGDGPIKLGIMASVQSNSISDPWVPQAAKIAAAAVNDAGGISGHKVQIDFCDDKGTPQGASLCAQKLLMQDKVLMMAGNQGTMEAALIPTLKAAKTISWASQGASLDALKSDRVYVLQPVLVQYRILPQMLPSTTRRVAYISADSAVARESGKISATYFPKSVGVTPLTVALTATDFQPICLKIKQIGADTAVVATAPAQIPSLIQTCHQIGLTDLQWAIPSIELTPQLVKTVSDLKQKNTVVMAFGKAAVDGFAADVAKYGPKVGGITNTVADDALNAWLAVKLAAKIIPAAGGPDAGKIKAWLDKQRSFDTAGATAPIDFTASPVPGTPRVKNTSASKGEISGGKLVVTDPRPYTFRPNGS